MARLNSEETLWTVFPIIVVVVLLIVGIIFLPDTNTDLRSRASEPKAIITPLIIPSKTIAPEVVCSDLYEPVCGSNKKTYSNSCEANLVGVTSFIPGACPTLKKPGTIPTPKETIKTTAPTTQSPQMRYVLPGSN